MKKKQGLTLRQLGNENIIVSQNSENINLSRIISLNETAGWLWNEIAESQEVTAELIAGLLCSRYDVEEETALADARELLENWCKAGIVE